jgi:hypothetical protein
MTKLHNWPSRPVVIVGSGPSLSDAQCGLIQDRRAADACRVIVINDNYRRVPNADILFAGDQPWWRIYSADVAKVAPNIERWSGEGSCREFGCHVWPIGPGRGIAPDSESQIRRGSSSGFMAVGLAVKFRARHIVLVGMDCKRSKDNKAHWFGDHPSKLPSPQPFDMWRDEFESLVAPAAERGINIVNCTIDTAIRNMRRSTLECELFPDDERNVAPDHQIDGGQASQHPAI